MDSIKIYYIDHMFPLLDRLGWLIDNTLWSLLDWYDKRQHKCHLGHNSLLEIHIIGESTYACTLTGEGLKQYKYKPTISFVALHAL